MKDSLSKSITKSDLDDALYGLSQGKLSRPDGITIEFYKENWNLIKSDYLAMVTKAIRDKKFSPGVTSGLITLIPKSGERSKLSNWGSIILFNVTYKLFAKVLQIHLQSVLIKIIDHDQLAFFPLRIILDNTMLIHETIA